VHRQVHKCKPHKSPSTRQTSPSERHKNKQDESHRNTSNEAQVAQATPSCASTSARATSQARKRKENLRIKQQQDRLPLNCALQGSCPLLPLLPIQGRRCKNCQYQNRAGQEIFINTMSVARSQTP
jgi:hypothetical protein